MCKINLGEYFKNVSLYYINNSEMRYGQSLINVLYEMYPQIAEYIVKYESDIDPFYSKRDSDTIKKFINYIDEMMN